LKQNNLNDVITKLTENKPKLHLSLFANKILTIILNIKLSMHIKLYKIVKILFILWCSRTELKISSQLIVVSSDKFSRSLKFLILFQKILLEKYYLYLWNFLKMSNFLAIFK